MLVFSQDPHDGDYREHASKIACSDVHMAMVGSPLVAGAGRDGVLAALFGLRLFVVLESRLARADGPTVHCPVSWQVI